MILKRVLRRIREHFPNTSILVRGDGHFSTPQLMAMIEQMPSTEFIFGWPSNAVINLFSSFGAAEIAANSAFTMR